MFYCLALIFHVKGSTTLSKIYSIIDPQYLSFTEPCQAHESMEGNAKWKRVLSDAFMSTLWAFTHVLPQFWLPLSQAGNEAFGSSIMTYSSPTFTIVSERCRTYFKTSQVRQRMPFQKLEAISSI